MYRGFTLGRSPANMLHLKPFNFNYTVGTGTRNGRYTAARGSRLQDILTGRRGEPVRTIVIHPVAEERSARCIHFAVLLVGAETPVVEGLGARFAQLLEYQGTPGGEERTGAARIEHKLLRRVAGADPIALVVVGVHIVLGNPNGHGGQRRVDGQLGIHGLDLAGKFGNR